MTWRQRKIHTQIAALRVGQYYWLGEGAYPPSLWVRRANMRHMRVWPINGEPQEREIGFYLYAPTAHIKAVPRSRTDQYATILALAPEKLEELCPWNQ